jgi:hypothetical protein
MNINKKLLDELIAYFPLTQHGSHRKRRVQQFFLCVYSFPWERV